MELNLANAQTLLDYDEGTGCKSLDFVRFSA
jgi:hypothetical protein